MEIDAATRRNLELTPHPGRRAQGQPAGRDRPHGHRRRRPGCWPGGWRARSTDSGRDRRAGSTWSQFCVAEDRPRDELRRALLRHCPDMERALSRLALGRGGPRDLAASATGWRAAEHRGACSPMPDGLPPLARGRHARSRDAPRPHRQLDAGLAPELPLLARDGGFIARGLAPQLDELRDAARRKPPPIAALEARYAARPASRSLKIRHNNVLGYYHRGRRRPTPIS